MARDLFVSDEFYSFQAEGANVGMPAYFVRLSGCNVRCDFCDEKIAWDKYSGEKLDVGLLVERINKCGAKNVVITGGEATIYDLREMTAMLHKAEKNIFLETSGVNPIKGEFDYIALSPKKKLPAKDENLKLCNELKIVIENKEDFLFAEENSKKVKKCCSLFLQPEWNRRKETIPMVISYIKSHPKWRISVQINKYLNEK